MAALLATVQADAVGAEPKLLEPEHAFAFSVQAVDDKTIEARFAIAKGYYLYRDKMRFNVEPPVEVAPAVLPPGEIKDDEYFGKVEIYRGSLALRLRVDKVDATRKVTVKTQSQGCAEGRVCYPPQVQELTLTLPAPGARPDPPTTAVPARKQWFN